MCQSLHICEINKVEKPLCYFSKTIFRMENIFFPLKKSIFSKFINWIKIFLLHVLFWSWLTSSDMSNSTRTLRLCNPHRVITSTADSWLCNTEEHLFSQSNEDVLLREQQQQQIKKLIFSIARVFWQWKLFVLVDMEENESLSRTW